jgi:hypothetical protein
MITPPQFLNVTHLRAMTPDEIVGMFFNTGFGMRGRVVYRLDTITYHCEVHTSGVEFRLLGINWLRGCRFFKTRAECDAPGLEAFERGAVMVAT